jgi:hypothetical protein
VWCGEGWYDATGHRPLTLVQWLLDSVLLCEKCIFICGTFHNLDTSWWLLVTCFKTMHTVSRSLFNKPHIYPSWFFNVIISDIPFYSKLLVVWYSVICNSLATGKNLLFL